MMKAKELALGGIMVAVSTVILYLSAILPISTISILTVASAVIPICIIRADIKTSIFVYIATSILVFFIAPINISILYTVFFGIYGIVKYFTERKHSVIIEMILKIIFFNISFLIGFFIMEKVLGINITAGIEQIISRFYDGSYKVISFVILWLVAQPIFLIYDYALTLIITIYIERIHKI